MRTTASTSSRTDRHAAATLTRGFTLIELLVVIAIVTILVSLITAVGSSVLSGGKARQSADAIRVVESAIDTYYDTMGTAPPAFVTAFRPDGPEPDGNSFTYESYAAYPMADAVDVTDGDVDRTRINAVGLFIREMENQGLGDVFSAVSSELMTRWDGDADTVELTATVNTTDGGRQPELRTIVDGWGNPIRFVHPAWDGAITEESNRGNPSPVGEFGTAVRPITENPIDTGYDYWLDPSRAPAGFDVTDADQFPIQLLRRDVLTEEDREQWSLGPVVTAIGDSDGGFTHGGRPYAYSAGPPDDGIRSDPSTTENNIYTSVPRFVVE